MKPKRVQDIQLELTPKEWELLERIFYTIRCVHENYDVEIPDEALSKIQKLYRKLSKAALAYAKRYPKFQDEAGKLTVEWGQYF